MSDHVSQSDHARLGQLIQANHPCIVISTFEEDEAMTLVRQVGIDRGLDPWVWSHVRGVHHGLLGDNQDHVRDTEHPAAALYHLQQKTGRFMGVLLDVSEHLKDAKTLRLLRETIEKFLVDGNTLVLIDHASEWPAVVSAHATPFELALPGVTELEEVVRATLRELHRQRPVKINITRGELRTMVKNLRGLTRRQAEQVIRDAVTEDRQFTADDINHVLAAKRRTIGGSGLLEYVESPMSLDEVGGLRRLKRWLKQRQGAHDEKAKQFGISPARGVLMLGVQGAGKSMCAKAIATAWQWPLLRMDPGALYDRFIGESERRLRDALAQAEAMAPIVLWIDEIEKGFASAASRSADGGLSQRMFGSLLTWMQDHEAPVFMVATANDIEALPPELLRKGRFDEVFFVDLPGAAVRKQIFAIHLRKRNRDPEAFALDALAAATEGFSGAEIEQAVQAALHEAFSAKKELDTAGIVAVAKASPPLSVTMAEKVNSLRQWADGRCVPAD
ncbi:AAA family ATPase [Phycisphaerales bacterium AB-hyl4]|uniref:Uncharacterized AAA domain-containing protein ycf46 n=1 Tax=Natronomicrosphaera hydrolytica TaxID=3242702 RepID=A0ABV4U3S0_9BACT